MRDVGDRIEIRHEVRDGDGTLTNATVTVVVTKPDGTTSSPAVANTSTGIYDASFTADTVGVWRWEWTVSGTVVDVDYGQVYVADPAPGTYATLPQLRARINATSGDRDEALQSALSAAARAFDRDTGRRPGGFYLDATATARTYRVYGRTVCDGGWYRLLVDDIGSETGLTVEVGDGSTWTTVAGTRTYPSNALPDRQPITAVAGQGWWMGVDLVRVTARWGWPAVPDEVVEAVLIAAQRLYRRKDSPEGIAGSSDFGPVRLSRIDPDYRRVVDSLSLPGIA